MDNVRLGGPEREANREKNPQPPRPSGSGFRLDFGGGRGGRNVARWTAGQARNGSVRRVADQRSHAITLPSLSITSPLGDVPLEDGINSPNLGSPLPSNLTVGRLCAPVTSLADALRNVSSAGASTPPVGGSAKNALFCLFASLERKIRLQDIVEVFQRHQSLMEPFMLRVLQIDNVFPPDFNLIGFLRDPSLAPQDGFFEFPMVMWPIITLFLVSCFYVTAMSVDYAKLVGALQHGGILTLGKGLFAALSVAESLTPDDLVRNTSRHYRAAFCAGIAYERKRALFTELVPNGQYGFSMLLVNIPISTLQLLIDQVNTFDAYAVSPNENHLAPLSEVQISRVISQRSAVVVGHPLDLMRLDMLVTTFAFKTGVKVHKDLLPTPVAENSRFYNQGLQHDVLHLWLDIGFYLESSDLKIPCFSPVNGSDLTASAELMMDIAGAVTCIPQDLTYSLQNLRDGDVLLDFSPSSMRIGQMIAWTRRNIVCLAEPSDHVERSILPSPRRSAEDALVLATLGKCATINHVLQSFLWDGKPAISKVQHLGTSFIDMKLLLDLDSVGGVNPVQGSFHSAHGELSITSFPVLRSSSPTLSSSPRGGASLTPAGAGAITGRGAFNVSMTNLGGMNTMAGRSHITTTSAGQRGSTGSLVLIPSAVNRQVMNMYEVAPLIKYLEMQHRCVLTKGAVEFAERLSRATKIDFPPFTLLLCPTALHLLEYWDGLEFVDGLKQESERRRRDAEAARDAPPEMLGAAVRRRRQLRRAAELLGSGVSSGTGVARLSTAQ